jgi:hypothetical protein
MKIEKIKLSLAEIADICAKIDKYGNNSYLGHEHEGKYVFGVIWEVATRKVYNEEIEKIYLNYGEFNMSKIEQKRKIGFYE